MKRQSNDMNFGTVPVVVPPELRYPDFQDFSEVTTEQLEEMSGRIWKPSRAAQKALARLL